MKFLKTHYGRAINIIPSDTVNIPNPAGLGSKGVTTDSSASALIDGNANFTTNLLGAIVVNITDGTIANVIGFTNNTTILLDADIFGSDGLGYSVYNSVNNEGCSIYIPKQAPAKLTVMTVGGDVILFDNCGDTQASSILPVNVLKVLSTDTAITGLVALW